MHTHTHTQIGRCNLPASLCSTLFMYVFFFQCQPACRFCNVSKRLLAMHTTRTTTTTHHTPHTSITYGPPLIYEACESFNISVLMCVCVCVPVRVSAHECAGARAIVSARACSRALAHSSSSAHRCTRMISERPLSITLSISIAGQRALIPPHPRPIGQPTPRRVGHMDGHACAAAIACSVTSFAACSALCCAAMAAFLSIPLWP